MIELHSCFFIYHHRTNSLPSFRTISIVRATAHLKRESGGEPECDGNRERSVREGKIEGGKEGGGEEEVGSHASLLALFSLSEVFP